MIAFYLSHRTDVDAYVAAVEFRIEKLRTDYQAGPGMLRIRKLIEERSHAAENA
jgi:hypothetical protein